MELVRTREEVETALKALMKAYLDNRGLSQKQFIGSKTEPHHSQWVHDRAAERTLKSYDDFHHWLQNKEADE